jgi:ATP-dependent 26S proteasome regulatory subunit
MLSRAELEGPLSKGVLGGIKFVVSGRGKAAALAKERIAVSGGVVVEKDAQAAYMVAVGGAGAKRAADADKRGVKVVTADWLEAAIDCGVLGGVPDIRDVLHEVAAPSGDDTANAAVPCRLRKLHAADATDDGDEDVALLLNGGPDGKRAAAAVAAASQSVEGKLSARMQRVLGVVSSNSSNGAAAGQKKASEATTAGAKTAASLANETEQFQRMRNKPGKADWDTMFDEAAGPAWEQPSDDAPAAAAKPKTGDASKLSTSPVPVRRVAPAAAPAAAKKQQHVPSVGVSPQCMVPTAKPIVATALPDPAPMFRIAHGNAPGAAAKPEARAAEPRVSAAKAPSVRERLERDKQQRMARDGDRQFNLNEAMAEMNKPRVTAAQRQRPAAATQRQSRHSDPFDNANSATVSAASSRSASSAAGPRSGAVSRCASTHSIASGVSAASTSMGGDFGSSANTSRATSAATTPRPTAATRPTNVVNRAAAQSPVPAAPATGKATKSSKPPLPTVARGRGAPDAGAGAAGPTLLQRCKESSFCRGLDDDFLKGVLAQVVSDGKKTEFKDVSGLAGCKDILYESVILPKLRPDLYTGMRQVCKGLLLFGPPGNGKTMLAKAVANECDTTFFNISASSLTSKWMGESEKMMRALFGVARALAPSTVFVDEIDSVLQKRGSASENESSRRLKTEFLVQMEGAGSDAVDAPVLVMAATNRPQDLDDAVIRRFDKRVLVPQPEHATRLELVRLLLEEQHSPALSAAEWDRFAALTEGYSGSDLKNLCCDIAMAPLRAIPARERLHVQTADLKPPSMADVEACVRKCQPSFRQEQMDQLREWDEKHGSRN